MTLDRLTSILDDAEQVPDEATGPRGRRRFRGRLERDARAENAPGLDDFQYPLPENDPDFLLPLVIVCLC